MGLQLLGGQPRFQLSAGAGLLRAHCEERASSLSAPLLLPPLSGVALPFQRPHSPDGVGEQGFPWQGSLPGKEVRRTVLPTDPAGSSGIWGPCGCSIAFPYFFNIEKIIFKNCDFFFKSFGWREGKRGTPKVVNMINWRYVTGGTF